MDNIAFVHESLTRIGGAERVMSEFHRMFPKAPIYALLREDLVVNALLPGADVRPSPLSRLPRFLRSRERLMTPILPVVSESFDLSEYQVVISSASAFAKGVITRPGTLHICYCHSPTRYLWDWYAHVLHEPGAGALRRTSMALLLHILRLWDVAASMRVDRFIANSRITAERIKKYYNRDSVVLYPPVDTERFNVPANDPMLANIRSQYRAGYFLIVSRLSPYKRIDLAVSAFNKLELPLVIVGEGRDRARLRRMAGKHITFHGFANERELPALYAGARAVVFPGEDDFGIVPVEAFSAGKPVIALRRGGATETIKEHITGEFFNEPHEVLLAEAVREYITRESQYHPDRIRAHAAAYSVARFRKEFRAYLEKMWEEWRQEQSH